MLTSTGSRVAERHRRLGIEACLTKPVKQSELLDTILTVVSGNSRRVAASAPGRGRRKKAARPLRVLVVEDNPVNQELLVQLLKRQGHRTEVAMNGRAALAALEDRGFDLVLMDVQMPIMGGFEATAAIREQEKKNGGHIPIVATTAHAMAGDRDRALATGMDAYLPKPIRANELYEVIERLTGRVIDEKALLEGIGGDTKLLRGLVRVFLADYPRLLARVRRAIKSKNPEALRASAHALKGAISNFGLPPAFESARRLELMGKSRRLRAANETYAALRQDIGRLKQQLRSL